MRLLVRRSHRDRDLGDVLDRHLVALGYQVRIRRLDRDARAALSRLRRDRRLRHAVAGYALVLRHAGVELPELDAAEG